MSQVAENVIILSNLKKKKKMNKRNNTTGITSSYYATIVGQSRGYTQKVEREVKSEEKDQGWHNIVNRSSLRTREWKSHQESKDMSLDGEYLPSINRKIENVFYGENNINNNV